MNQIKSYTESNNKESFTTFLHFATEELQVTALNILKHNSTSHQFTSSSNLKELVRETFVRKILSFSS